MPFNLAQLREERRAKLDLDDQAFSFVDSTLKFAGRNPGILTFVYDSIPTGFHDWGGPEGRKALAGQTVAYASWDTSRRQLTISVRPPGP